jgi:hypothetical protein
MARDVVITSPAPSARAHGRVALLAASQAISILQADRLRAEPSQLLRHPSHFGTFLAWAGNNLPSKHSRPFRPRPPARGQGKEGSELEEGHAPTPVCAPAGCARPAPGGAVASVSRADTVLCAALGDCGDAVGRAAHCAAERPVADWSGGAAEPRAIVPDNHKGRAAEQPRAKPAPIPRRCDMCDSVTAKPGVCHHCWFDKWDSVVQLRNLERKAVARREPQAAVRPTATAAPAEDVLLAQAAAQPPALLPRAAGSCGKGVPRDGGGKRRVGSGMGEPSGDGGVKLSRRSKRHASHSNA